MKKNRYGAAEIQAGHAGMVAFIMRTGIVRTEAAANNVLVGLLIVLFIVSAILLYKGLSPDARLTMTPEEFIRSHSAIPQ